MSLPVYSRSHFGILNVPISSHCLWCVQPSATRTVSPSLSRSICRAPRTASSRNPLYLAIRIEKEVSGICSGTVAATRSKTWLSVITMAMPLSASAPFLSAPLPSASFPYAP